MMIILKAVAILAILATTVAVCVLSGKNNPIENIA